MANVITVRYDVTKWVDHPGSDLCEHVEADHSLAYVVYAEDDTFGPVGRIVVCEPCHEKTEDQKSYDPCRDCGKSKTNREMNQWKWYDFYAPQGDEPYYICDDCWSKDKHQARMKEDRRQGHEEEIHLGLRCGTCEKYVGSKYFGQQYLCDCDYVCCRCSGQIDKDDVEKHKHQECAECRSKCESCETPLVHTAELGTHCPKKAKCVQCNYLSHTAHKDESNLCSTCQAWRDYEDEHPHAG